MPNGIESRGFELRPKKTKEKSPEEAIEAIKKHIDSIKEPLLSKIPKGRAKKFLSDFFRKAEGGSGPECDALLNLRGDKEWEARKNSKNFEEILDYFLNPPEGKGLETKTGPKKTEIDPEIDRNLKFIQAILQQEYNAASSERKMLVDKSERKQSNPR